MPEINMIRVQGDRSPGVAFLLTLLFGPLGLFYSSTVGGIFMVTIALVVGVVTMGWGFLITWPISIVWGVCATIAHRRH